MHEAYIFLHKHVRIWCMVSFIEKGAIILELWRVEVDRKFVQFISSLFFMMFLGIGIICTEKCWSNSPTYSTDVGVLRGWGRAQITVDILGREAKKVEKHCPSGCDSEMYLCNGRVRVSPLFACTQPQAGRGVLWEIYGLTADVTWRSRVKSTVIPTSHPSTCRQPGKIWAFVVTRSKRIQKGVNLLSNLNPPHPHLCTTPGR